MGWLLLGVLGFFGLKMFGGGNAPSAANGVLGLDPATGAKLFNSRDFSTITATIAQAPRIPATPVANGQQYCPYPFKLYKDQADGKFYCYNESQIPTSTVAAPSTLTGPGQLSAPTPGTLAAGLSAQNPSTYSAPSTLTPPSDAITASNELILNPATFDTTNIPTSDTLTPPGASDFVQTGGLDDSTNVPAGSSVGVF